VSGADKTPADAGEYITALSEAELLAIRTKVQADSARGVLGHARDCLAEPWSHDDWPSRVGSLTYFTRTLADEVERVLEREQEWTRAASADAGKLAAIRAVLARFDWERDDRQLALEEIDRIAGGAS
jgi:hypothetical protein